MSIGYRKISEMISESISDISELNEKQAARLEQLCNKIYMLEASTDNMAATKMVEDLMGEISIAADRIKELGE